MTSSSAVARARAPILLRCLTRSRSHLIHPARARPRLIVTLCRGARRFIAGLSVCACRAVVSVFYSKLASFRTFLLLEYTAGGVLVGSLLGGGRGRSLGTGGEGEGRPVTWYNTASDASQSVFVESSGVLAAKSCANSRVICGQSVTDGRATNGGIPRRGRTGTGQGIE